VKVSDPSPSGPPRIDRHRQGRHRGPDRPAANRLRSGRSDGARDVHELVEDRIDGNAERRCSTSTRDGRIGHVARLGHGPDAGDVGIAIRGRRKEDEAGVTPDARIEIDCHFKIAADGLRGHACDLGIAGNH
jgi:hypothetical protein